MSRIGTQTTLDDTPPSFTRLQIQDPTAYNTKIIVTFSLNEAGTAYCRATMSESGETSGGMAINRILSANWSGEYSSGTTTIEMTTLSKIDPTLTVSSDEIAPFYEQTQYHVYCWAKDSALDSAGLPRPNYMSQPYVDADVGSPLSPSGGTTPNVWVVDSTPPTMIFVQAESVNHETIQLTLQLNEPGTLWCAAAELDTSAVNKNCKESGVQDSSLGAYCYWEMYIKGSKMENTVFRADVHESFRDVDIEVNAIWEKDTIGHAALNHEHPYKIFCFAEDNWKLRTDSAARNSPNYIAGEPNKSPWSAVTAFKEGIGMQTTLDETPPSFTQLAIQDPTAYNTKIIVTFSLNEAGTAYCRVTRTDSGESAADVPINRILTANWSAAYSSGTATIEMTNLENVSPELTVRDDDMAALTEATQYDVYCWAQDDAEDSFGIPRLNYMLQDYVSANIVSPTAPQGGRTGGVWVVDSTPPLILPVASEPIAEDTIHITLQLNEPGTLWCATILPDNTIAPNAAQFCKTGELQESNPGQACYFETYIKGRQADGTVFRADAHNAFRDYDIEVNRMWYKSQTGSVPLPAQTDFDIMCFAEDDWRLESSNAAVNSPNYVIPANPNKVDLAHVLALRSAIDIKKTLDTTPPTVLLTISAPSSSESSLAVHVTFNEAGILYCLPLLKGTAAPHASRIVSYDLSYSCTDPAGCTGGLLTVPNLLQEVDYDVHCYAEDDNTYPQKPNGVTLPVLSAQVNDITPPVIRIVKAEAPEKDLIVVTLQLDEEGTVFCFCPTILDEIVYVEWVTGYGASTEVTSADIDRNVQVRVRHHGGYAQPLVEQTNYVTYCAAKDTAVNPDCTGCTVPNLSTLAEIRAARDSIGTLMTLDQSPPSFTHLGARGISETQIRVSFTLNEPGTTYCRATRTDAGEPPLHINHVIQANWQLTQENVTQETLLEFDIDKLSNRAGEFLLSSGTAYDVYCWAEDTAELKSCTPMGYSAACIGEAMPNYMLQGYVEIPFSSTLYPPFTEAPANGGRIDMVRTWDTTPPNLIFVEAESREESSITVTLQLNEPGTAYCRAYPYIDPGNTTFDEVLNAPDGPFRFELPSDSPTRIYTAHAHRNFEITVSSLSREVLYFVYCAAEDDEDSDGCSQRATSDDPSCTRNRNTPYLTEAVGRYTLDLTPPVFSVVNARSTTQDSVTVAVSLDEAGTAWCSAVFDQFAAPTVNQIIAAGFQSEASDAGIINVTVTNLVKDTEYDMYCFARDDGTKSARNDTVEVQLSVKNPVSYFTVMETKMDAHVIYDSLAPVLLELDPVNQAFQVDPAPNITLTFNEDIKAGTGSVVFRTTGEMDVLSTADEMAFINNIAYVMVNSSTPLKEGKTWRVLLPSGLILDSLGNEFAGIPDGEYNLQT